MKYLTTRYGGLQRKIMDDKMTNLSKYISDLADDFGIDDTAFKMNITNFFVSNNWFGIEPVIVNGEILVSEKLFQKIENRMQEFCHCYNYDAAEKLNFLLKRLCALFPETGLLLDKYIKSVKLDAYSAYYFTDFLLYYLIGEICEYTDKEIAELMNLGFDNLPKIYGDIDRLGNSYLFSFINHVSDFISMLPVNECEDVRTRLLYKLDSIEDRINTNSTSFQRNLADFESYFRFNDILKQFWSEAIDKTQKLFYFPVWLWWNLSGVLPLRPREYILTPRKCLSMINGKFYLTVARNKIKGKNKTKAYKISEDYQKVTYEIPEHLAKEIEWYIQATNDYANNELNTLFIADLHYAKWEHNRPYKSRYFTYTNLRTCLRYFFDEIVWERYGYKIIFERNENINLNEKEINYLCLGDTRHLAMINLIAEGATPMIAMMLAGHDNPEMSSHYYSNISKLIECRTYRQYKNLINGKQNYLLSKRIGDISVKSFIRLNNNSRCYSAKVAEENFEDCYKVAGPSGEIGFCPKCTYYRPENKSFQNSKDLYRNRILAECENLTEIVNKVRKGKGEKEEITQILLRLRDADYSYQQYLLETMEGNDAKN